MAKRGDSYEVKLSETHVDWGNYRDTYSRDRRDGEAYIPIPADKARRFKIYNSNFKEEGLGYNKFYVRAARENFSGILKSSGCRRAGDVFAKQFHGDNDLRLLGEWFRMWGAEPGSTVYVTWLSPTEIEIDHD